MALLEDVKTFLNFTWTDPVKEANIINYIESSKIYLNNVAGIELDFESPSLARELLFNRVLYMDSHALIDFQENYNSMLNELEHYGEVQTAKNQQKLQ